MSKNEKIKHLQKKLEKLKNDFVKVFYEVENAPDEETQKKKRYELLGIALESLKVKEELDELINQN